MNWQPLETAPKDGTRLLLLSGPEIDVGYWSESVWCQTLATQGAWIIYENRSDTVILYPTHWMPLPPWPEGINQ